MQQYEVYPKYLLEKLNDHSDYSLTIDNNYQFLFKNYNLTNIVWHVTQEFHSHNFWEICFVIKGDSMQRFPNKPPCKMHRGSVYLLRPNDVHCISPVQSKEPTDITSSTYTHRDIYIPIDEMRRICGALQENLYEQLLDSELPLSATLSPSETNQLESLLNSYTGKNEDFSFMHSVIVSHILCALIENKRHNQGDYPEWLNTLLSNLNREEFMTKSVKEIIDSIGYNQSYACRQFKKYTNKTLTDYIHLRKCSYSTTLLANADVPISKISHRLNFADQSAYIKIFKSIYKITPGQWRKQQTKITPPHLKNNES